MYAYFSGQLREMVALQAIALSSEGCSTFAPIALEMACRCESAAISKNQALSSCGETPIGGLENGGNLRGFPLPVDFATLRQALEYL